MKPDTSGRASMVQPAVERRSAKAAEAPVRSRRAESPPALGTSGSLASALAGAVPSRRASAMEGGGSTGQQAAEGEPLTLPKETPTLKPPSKNENGLYDGEATSDVHAKVFVNNGKTGTAAVHWSGGTGGRFNQGVGSITLSAPTLDGADAPSDKEMASAWITAGTGTATVTRSYTGVLVGANNNWYITAGAAARIDTHEGMHMTSTKKHHDTNITPLEARVAQHTGQPKALRAGKTKAEAIAALQAFLKWNDSVDAFKTGDTTDNTPMGTVDTTDLASADYPKDRGPRNVGGTNYAHYIAKPGEPEPVPPPAAAAAPAAGGGT
jgi:hypothetical protein